MKLEDHALIYRPEPRAWHAARWHFGSARWLPVLHIQGASKSAACRIIRDEPGCNHTIVAAPVDIESETLESVDRFTALPSATVICRDGNLPGPIPSWRRLFFSDGRPMALRDQPGTLFPQTFLAERIEELKRPPRDPEDERPYESYAQLLRWDWDADSVVAANARAA